MRKVHYLCLLIACIVVVLFFALVELPLLAWFAFHKTHTFIAILDPVANKVHYDFGIGIVNVYSPNGIYCYAIGLLACLLNSTFLSVWVNTKYRDATY